MAFSSSTVSTKDELSQAIKPCRDGVAPPKKNEPQPDYVSPEPKTAAEKREWTRLSETMESYHNYFKRTFQDIWENADKVGEKGLTLKRYLSYAADLEHHLHMHHDIEEKYVFPVLGKKMPAFRDNHVEEHKSIHAGLDRYAEYIKKAQAKASLYSPEEFRKIMSSFGPVMFFHLDAEVKSLKIDNLRRYYTIDEFRSLPLPM